MIYVLVRGGYFISTYSIYSRIAPGRVKDIDMPPIGSPLKVFKWRPHFETNSSLKYTFKRLSIKFCSLMAEIEMIFSGI
jgi:hypothetical protein